MWLCSPGALHLFGERLPTSALKIYHWLRKEHPDHSSTSQAHQLLSRYLQSEEQNQKQVIDLSTIPLLMVSHPLMLEKILRIPTHQKFEAGSSIFRSGEQPEAFFIITTGTVEIIEPDGVLHTLRAGQYFEEVALLLDHPFHTKSAIAKTNIEVLRFSKSQLSEWFRDNPFAQR